MSLKFDTPAGANPIDRERVVGRPLDRVEGPLKVSGTAPYAYERHDVAPDATYGWVVGSTIAKGRIQSIDTRVAEAAPGVIAVIHAANAGQLGQSGSHAVRLLGGPEIEHYDQAVALVVAERFEQARHAAALLKIDYVVEDGRYDLEDAIPHARQAPRGFGGPGLTRAGDFEAGYAAAAVQLDERYTTPDQSHQMMEPHASTARWDGDALTLWTSNQMIADAVGDMAVTLGIAKDKVRIISPYIGGGFGSKLWVRADAVLAAIAARHIGRPVKVALARPQIANNTTHRPATVQRIRLGADPDARIVAIGHESWSGNQPGGGTESAGIQTRLLYRGENRLVAHYLTELNLPEGNAMRAPGEAAGMLALEVAMDELAEKVGLDPVELRIRNDVQYDPEKGPERPFSSRPFIECLRIGAKRFGWSERLRTPASRREGQWLIGMGMAAAFRGNLVTSSHARVGIERDGRVWVETDMTDIGTGSYTIIAQTAAEMLGVDIADVDVRLGDSAFPKSAGSGGQWGANSATAGVYAACLSLRREIAQKAGFNEAEVDFADGHVISGNRRIALGEAAGPDGISLTDGIDFGSLSKRYAQATFGAHFCEVGVDIHTGEIRIRRQAGAFAAGRILNPKSARSQVIGSMTMGAGAALMEELVVDPRFGYFVTRDLVDYHVPVHADIPDQDVFFLPELDDKSSPMKAKGVGELGICGAGAAIANAVYNATGIRLRDYPLTLDKLIDRLPPP